MTEYSVRDRVWPRFEDRVRPRVEGRASAQVWDRAWPRVWRRVWARGRQQTIRQSLHAALWEETEP